jgi:hypothetical protein
MIIFSTAKSSSNNYLNNTQTQAMVHLMRTIASDEPDGPLDIVVEELGKITDVYIQSRTIGGLFTVEHPDVDFEGNVITLAGWNPDEVYSMIIIGAR